MSRRSPRLAAAQANVEPEAAEIDDVGADIQVEEAPEEKEDMRDQVVNPMFERFMASQQFEAFMRANPVPAVVPMPMTVPVAQHNPRREPVVDPGMMVAMSQVKTPTLEGLKIAQIKAYRRYESKCIVAYWKRLPGQLVLPEHLCYLVCVSE